MNAPRPSPPSRERMVKNGRSKPRADAAMMFAPAGNGRSPTHAGTGTAKTTDQARASPCNAPDFDEARELRKMEMRKTLEAEMGTALTNAEAETIMRQREIAAAEVAHRGRLHVKEYHDRIELVLIRVVCIENIRRAQRERDQERKWGDLMHQHKVNQRVASYGAAIAASNKKQPGGHEEEVGGVREKTPPPCSGPPAGHLGTRVTSPGAYPVGTPKNGGSGGKQTPPLRSVSSNGLRSGGSSDHLPGGAGTPLNRRPSDQLQSRESRSTDSRGKTPPLDVSRFVRTENVLGKGAFGVVYEGFDQETGRFVAIKEATFQRTGPNVDQQLKKIINEVRMMKQLNHPNIVQYITAERSKNNLYIYMELVNGGSITSAIASLKGRGFPENIVKIYTRQICRGLGYLHSLNVAHRDIKGDNVLLDKGSGVIKLADFNSSKQISDLSCDGTNTLAGTLWYMAPEMIQGRSYSFSADVWSLGITVIEMLTGSPPFVNDFNEKGPHAALFHIAQLQDPYPMPPKIVHLPNAHAWLRCCLTRDPNNRSTVQQLTRHQWLCEVPFPERTSSPDVMGRHAAPLFNGLGELRDSKKGRTHGYSNHASVTSVQALRGAVKESPLLASSLGRSGLPAPVLSPANDAITLSPRPGSGRLPSLQPSSRGQPSPMAVPDTPPLLSHTPSQRALGPGGEGVGPDASLILRRKIDVASLGDRFNQMFPVANLADGADTSAGSPLSIPSPLSHAPNNHSAHNHNHPNHGPGLQVMSVT